MIKEVIKLNTTKQEYPDMTFEQVQEMVKRMNEEARRIALEKKKEQEVK